MRNMIDAVGMYREHLTRVKHCSPNTLSSYMRDIGQFTDYCARREETDLADADEDLLIRYADFLQRSGKSESTQMRAFASLRGFFDYLVAAGLCTENPAKHLRREQTQARHVPEILTVREVQQMLEQPRGNDFKGCRDRAMLQLMYATGVKVGELVQMQVSDLNLTVGVVQLRDERKERTVPIYPQAVQCLKEYLNTARPSVVLDRQQTCLFTNKNGQPLSRQGLWKIVKSYAESAGIHKDITPLTLRHSFAAHLLENGADLAEVKEMLGHADISTTAIYATLVKNKYASSYSKFHPFAKIK